MCTTAVVVRHRHCNNRVSFSGDLFFAKTPSAAHIDLTDHSGRDQVVFEFFLLIVRAIGLACRGRRELVLENLVSRGAESDHRDGSRESVVGCAAHPWRTAKARDSGVGTYGITTGRASLSSTLPNLLHVLREPCSALASMDFFTVHTLTGRLLFVFVVLSHQRRRILHVNCAARPTSAWTAQQLVEAFPHDTAPRWLLRDRDNIYDDSCAARSSASASRRSCPVRGIPGRIPTSSA